jgi:hypothetical protein
MGRKETGDEVGGGGDISLPVVLDISERRNNKNCMYTETKR